MATTMNGTASEQVYLSVPSADMELFKRLMGKFGWKYKTNKDTLRQFVSTRPKAPRLTDDDIMEELRAVRYE